MVAMAEAMAVLEVQQLPEDIPEMVAVMEVTVAVRVSTVADQRLQGLVVRVATLEMEEMEVSDLLQEAMALVEREVDQAVVTTVRVAAVE
tara:strand:+ start:354 stop:623 length:270 start_codon:yes stop_codon:yes gene_type:complete